MLSRLDKFWIALTSLGLASLILGALGLAALILASGCVHRPPIPPAPEETFRVVLPATAENDWLFCVEDPNINGTFEQPVIRTGLSCPWRVWEVRLLVARLRVAD